MAQSDRFTYPETIRSTPDRDRKRTSICRSSEVDRSCYTKISMLLVALSLQLFTLITFVAPNQDMDPSPALRARRWICMPRRLRRWIRILRPTGDAVLRTGLRVGVDRELTYIA